MEWYLFIIRQLSHDVVSSSLRVTVALKVCDSWIFRLETIVLLCCLIIGIHLSRPSYPSRISLVLLYLPGWLLFPHSVEYKNVIISRSQSEFG